MALAFPCVPRWALVLPLHGAPAPPVPHWLVLLVTVPGLWVLAWAAVRGLDWILDAVAETRDR